MRSYYIYLLNNKLSNKVLVLVEALIYNHNLYIIQSETVYSKCRLVYDLPLYPTLNLPLTTSLSQLYLSLNVCTFADNFNAAVIGASVGSAATMLLLAIVVVLIIITCMALLKPKKKGEVFNSDLSIISGQLQSYTDYLISQK